MDCNDTDARGIKPVSKFKHKITIFTISQSSPSKGKNSVHNIFKRCPSCDITLVQTWQLHIRTIDECQNHLK